MKTIVKFLKQLDIDGTIDIFAYFPHENYCSHLYGPTQKQCYSLTDGKGSCSTDYASESELASYDEYKPLLDELISLGYNDLEIINQQIETKQYDNAYKIMHSKLSKEEPDFDKFTEKLDKWVADHAPKYLLTTK